jgi:putative membrane protein
MGEGMIFQRKCRINPWVGMAAGLIGGIAGSFAIGTFSHVWAKATKSNPEDKGVDSTVKAASAFSESVLHHQLTEEEKPKAAAAVHYGFGATMGALYGAGAALKPAVGRAAGVPFGVGVYLAAHAAAVPALGWSKPITQNRFSDEVGELLGHVVYGLVTDLTRRGVIAAYRAI